MFSYLTIIVPRFFYTVILLFALLSELALTDFVSTLPEDYIAGSEDELPEGIAVQEF